MLNRCFISFELVEGQLFSWFQHIHLRQVSVNEMLIHGLAFPQSMEVHSSVPGHNFQHIRKEHKHCLFVYLEDFFLRDEDFGAAKEIILLVEVRLIVDTTWQNFNFAMDE